MKFHDMSLRRTGGVYVTPPGVPDPERWYEFKVLIKLDEEEELKPVISTDNPDGTIAEEWLEFFKAFAKAFVAEPTKGSEA